MDKKSSIVVHAHIKKPVTEVWEIWTQPEHIQQWNFAHESWHCPSASNDPSVGGRFSWRMEARDGSMGFDYAGTYLEVDPARFVRMRLDDGREVQLEFQEEEHGTHIIETFEPDESVPHDQQKMGWQAILDNLKAYAESQSE